MHGANVTIRAWLLVICVVLGAQTVPAQQRGPLWLLGKMPDRNPYGCTTSTTGTYVGPSASITDDGCATWTLGAGTTPNIVILRNGSQACGAFGAQIEWYNSALYVQGDNLEWYIWNGSCFDFFGSDDPSGGSATPTGYFVSTSGDDSRSCMTATNIATPKRTFSDSMTCLSAGDVLYARGGTYDEYIVNGIPAGTSWTNKVRIAAYPGETVWLSPTTPSFYAIFIYQGGQQYIEFDGINVDASVAIAGAIKVEATIGNNPHHIRFQNMEVMANPSEGNQGFLFDQQGYVAIGGNEVLNCTIHRIGNNTASDDPGLHGIYAKSGGNIFDGNNIYGAPSAAIQLYNSGSSMTGNIVRNNLLHDSLPRGGLPTRHWGVIIADGCIDTQVYNNVIYGITSEGGSSSVGLYDFAGLRTLSYNNTIYGNEGEGVVEEIYASNSINKNNIVYLNAGGNYRNSGTGTTGGATYNLIGTNPVVVNAAGNDYRLQTSSPAKDTGFTFSSIFTTDLQGIPRPQGPAWDMGAYEFH